jgi:hypothetical protein
LQNQQQHQYIWKRCCLKEKTYTKIVCVCVFVGEENVIDILQFFISSASAKFVLYFRNHYTRTRWKVEIVNRIKEEFLFSILFLFSSLLTDLMKLYTITEIWELYFLILSQMLLSLL